jgi:hypothetical protein
MRSDPCSTTAAAQTAIRAPQRIRGSLRWAATSLALACSPALCAPVFNPDNQPTGWVTRPALTRYNLISGNEIVYYSEYYAGEWTGELRANAIDALGSVSDYPVWPKADAGLQIADDAVTEPWKTHRRVVTRKRDITKTGTGWEAGTSVAFLWGNLHSKQQDVLNKDKLVNYLRGDRTNEAPNGEKYRARRSLLGDIQHSTLIHWRHSDGSRRLYVGANDGMLHVFDAEDGEEVFAYVPSLIHDRLAQLASATYTHKPFVDGPLAIGNITLTGATTPSTLLVGGLGGGGRGLFCLDMTTPTATTEAEAASKIKWEVSNTRSGYANLGYTYAAPRLARLNTGQAAVIVGNGYVNTGNGQASLFVIDPTDGALIKEIGTGSGTTTSPNGLSSPTLVDDNGDGKVDYVYAGDIDGNLWKFNLTGTNTATYSATKLHTTSPAQAITTAPVVFPHPMGGYMVMFGTGRMLTADDATSTATHYVYGLWDGRPAENTTWLDQTLTAATTYDGLNQAVDVRTATSNLPNWGTGYHMGWRLTLPAGERVVGENPLYNDGRLYFTSTNPTVVPVQPSPPSIELPNGSNWLHEVNYLTGGSPPRPVFDINRDNAFDDLDKVGGVVVAGAYLGPGVYSQPVVVDMAQRATTLFATNSDLAVPPPSGSGDPGVSGGHFDVDIYYGPAGGFANKKHTHQYDDKFDVTGVNFLAPSVLDYKINNAITNVATPFKILVMNQYLNPASQLSIGGTAFVSVKDYGVLATSTNATTVINSLPVYTLDKNALSYVKTFTWKLPVDAFQSKDWWGDGGAERAGLIPTTTGCVNKISSGSTGATSTLGQFGERHNGAFTIQIIKADTPASAIELNYPSGGAKFGWRVKAANFSSYVLAEYTMFWHHENGKCYGQSGWVPNPPQDFDGGGKASVPAVGSLDPSGSFSVAPDNATATLLNITTSVNGTTTTYTYNYSDGTTKTETRTDNRDGTITITRGDETRRVTVGGGLDQHDPELLNPSRRISWREVITR